MATDISMQDDVIEDDLREVTSVSLSSVVVDSKLSSVHWSPRSASRCIVATYHDKVNSIQVWDTTSSSCTSSVNVEASAYATSLSGNEQVLVASLSNGSLLGFDSNLKQIASTPNVHSGPCTDAAVNGNTIASVGEDGRLTLTQISNKGYESLGSRENASSASLYAVCFSGAGTVATAGLAGTISIWDIRSPELEHKQPTCSRVPASIASLAFVSSSQLLVCGDDEGVLHAWDSRFSGENQGWLRSVSRHTAASPVWDVVEAIGLRGCVWSCGQDGRLAITDVASSNAEEVGGGQCWDAMVPLNALSTSECAPYDISVASDASMLSLLRLPHE